jgi:hypothetical protein
MQPLVERAAVVVRRLDRAAVPLPELTRLLREGGTVVSEGVLLRSLVAEPERFRVLEPWRALRRFGESGETAWGRSAWVVPGPRPTPPDPLERQRPALRRLSATVAGLGWALDPTSSTDVARWFGMVLEAERFRSAVPAEGRGAAPHALSDPAGDGPSATPRPRRPLPETARARRRRRAAPPAPAPGVR